MQEVCDTLLSPETLGVINEVWGDQVQISQRLFDSEAGLHYKQSSQQGSAQLPGAMGNIYRTDTLTTINDNWLFGVKSWEWREHTVGKDFPIDISISGWMMRLRQNLNPIVASLHCDVIQDAGAFIVADLCTVSTAEKEPRSAQFFFLHCICSWH